MNYFEGGFFIHLYDEAGSNTVRLTNQNALYKNVQSLKDDFIKIQEIKLEFFLLLLLSMTAFYLLFLLLFILKCGFVRFRRNLRSQKGLEPVIYNAPY